MHVISIDPGLNGAITEILDGIPIKCVDMPTVKVGTKTVVCADMLSEILFRMRKSNLTPHPTVAVIEQVGASPRMGVSSAFNFGDSFGTIRGVCAGLILPYYTITPQRWKAYHGLQGKPKDATRLKAIELFPEQESFFRRKKDVDRADALLMGLAWLRMKAK